MNTKNITISIAVIAVLALAFILYPKQADITEIDSPMEVLDKSTRDDTTNDIDADLNKINLNASSTEDFKTIDTQINSL